MIDLNDIDEALKYYNIDNKYKDRCYECANNINNNELFLYSFNRVNDILNNHDFEYIKELWKHEDINELFCKGIDLFVTNLIILLSYKNRENNINNSNLDEEQKSINKNRIKECFLNDLINRKYESVRISQMLWAFYFIRVRIIEVGRLQYQLLDINDDNSIFKIHIPKGDKLDYDEVINSINLSKIKIKEFYNTINIKYICESWLLSKQINKVINNDSNIHKFYELFNVVDGEDCIEDILNFVYQKKGINNYNELQEDTTLQRIIKKELINGTIFKKGNGVLKKY